MPPTTRYAKHEAGNIAYQTVGEGALDVVVSPSFVSHLDFAWSHPAVKSFYERIAEFSTLTIFDKLGTGLSDPVGSVPTLEERSGEIEAVMDAAGIERAALIGLSEGGAMAIDFAATRPGRVSALVLLGAVFTWIVDFPAVVDGRRVSPEQVRREAVGAGISEPLRDEQVDRLLRFTHHVVDDWGQGKALKVLVPNMGDRNQLGMIERISASPGMAVATMSSASRLDVSHLLGAIRVPTLVVHAKEDLVPIQMARELERRLPEGRLLEVEGVDHAPWLTEPDAILAEVEQMLTGARHPPPPSRSLATVLFTDICGSTERAAELGDSRWRTVLERHEEISRREISAAGGECVKNTGDGYLATFEGPAAAIRGARGLRDCLAAEGIVIRAGLHTGEIERLGDDVGGMAVHIAARVSALAGDGEILVSRTIPDLVVGSRINFAEHGTHALKGVPGEWELFAVLDEDERPGPGDEPGEVALNNRHAQRRIDRVAVAMSQRVPGLMRAAIKMDPRYRGPRFQAVRRAARRRSR